MRISASLQFMIFYSGRISADLDLFNRKIYTQFGELTESAENLLQSVREEFNMDLCTYPTQNPMSIPGYR